MKPLRFGIVGLDPISDPDDPNNQFSISTQVNPYQEPFLRP